MDIELLNKYKVIEWIPYSKKLMCYDFNAKVINVEEINAVKEYLLYFFNEINMVSTWFWGSFNFFFTSTIYGEMTSFRRCKVSSSLLQCDLLSPSKKPSANSTVGNGWLALPIHIISKGNISPLKVSANVSAIACLSLAPYFGTCLEFFSAMVTPKVGTYFDGVWSTFIIRSSGIVYVCTKVQMLCKNNVQILIHKASVMTGLDVVTVLQSKFILLYKEYSQPSIAVNSKYPP